MDGQLYLCSLHLASCLMTATPDGLPYRRRKLRQHRSLHPFTRSRGVCAAVRRAALLPASRLHGRRKENEAMKTLTYAPHILLVWPRQHRRRPNHVPRCQRPDHRHGHALTATAPRHSAMARAAPPAQPPEIATARQRSVMLAAGPPAQPQRRDAERRSSADADGRCDPMGVG